MGELIPESHPSTSSSTSCRISPHFPSGIHIRYHVELHCSPEMQLRQDLMLSHYIDWAMEALGAEPASEQSLGLPSLTSLPFPEPALPHLLLLPPHIAPVLRTAKAFRSPSASVNAGEGGSGCAQVHGGRAVTSGRVSLVKLLGTSPCLTESMLHRLWTCCSNSPFSCVYVYFCVCAFITRRA